MDANQQASIKALIQKINISKNIGIDWDGLQVVLDCVLPIVNSSLGDLIERKTNNGEGIHSILIPMLHNYLETGFKGLVSYKKEKTGSNPVASNL